jgi:hypothetical protein
MQSWSTLTLDTGKTGQVNKRDSKRMSDNAGNKSDFIVLESGEENVLRKQWLTMYYILRGGEMRTKS